ncbi:hypothetical protein A4X13_0g2339 [Tilletia indica]|uniref:Uncharacterized protein n=1 Tax=Tilletia indica TaxID=43049 RepID=A0A177THY8_9BASI|nr:hypothetical protein A4X13_0g2339 [Tilletia indica]
MSTYCDQLRDFLEDELDDAFTEAEPRTVKRRVKEILEEQIVRVGDLESEVKASKDMIRFLRASRDIPSAQEELATMRQEKLTLEQTLRTTQFDLNRIQAELDEKVATEINYNDRVRGLMERQKERALRVEFQEQLEDLEGQYKDILNKMKQEHDKEMKEAIAAKKESPGDGEERILTMREEIRQVNIDRKFWEEEASRWKAEANRWETLCGQTRAARDKNSTTDLVNRVPNPTIDVTSSTAKMLPSNRWNSSPPIMTTLPFPSWITMDIDNTSETAEPRASSPVLSTSTVDDTISDISSIFESGVRPRTEALEQCDTHTPHVEETRRKRARVWVNWVAQ